MHKIEFECQVITPMFLAGADGRTPELRPQSIKGSMRFWWRAMNGHLSIDDLRKREAEIFGGSGDNGGRSKINIRIKDTVLKIANKGLQNEYNLKWHYNPNKRVLEGNDAGIGYLFYSVIINKKNRFIKEDSRFIIEFSSYDKKSLLNVISAFWALAFFGGLGSRARRGGGNFIVLQIHDVEKCLEEIGIDFFIENGDSASISDWLTKNYSKIYKLVSNYEHTDFIYEYSNLSFSRFIISNKNFVSWTPTLNAIGTKYKNFRTKNKKDIFDTAAFGLPRKYIETSDPRNYNRRSSPLIIRTLKVRNRYYWMVLRLAGQFFPETIVLKNKGKSQRPNYSLIDAFWNNLRQNNRESILSIPDRLKKLKKQIQEQLNPSEIILFGSRARGDFSRKSDIDIAISKKTGLGILDDIIEHADIIDISKVDKEFQEKIKKEGVKL